MLGFYTVLELDKIRKTARKRGKSINSVTDASMCRSWLSSTEEIGKCHGKSKHSVGRYAAAMNTIAVDTYQHNSVVFLKRS